MPTEVAMGRLPDANGKRVELHVIRRVWGLANHFIYSNNSHMLRSSIPNILGLDCCRRLFMFGFDWTRLVCHT